jgi:hypothetical protein
MSSSHQRRSLPVQPLLGIGLAAKALGMFPALAIDIPCPPTASLAVVGAGDCPGIAGLVPDGPVPAVFDTGPSIAPHACPSLVFARRSSRARWAWLRWSKASRTSLQVLRFLLGAQYAPLSVHLPHRPLAAAGQYAE